MHLLSSLLCTCLIIALTGPAGGAPATPDTTLPAATSSAQSDLAETVILDGTDPHEQPVQITATAKKDNVSGWQAPEGGAGATDKIEKIETPPADTTYVPLSDEESAARLAAGEKQQKEILETAQKSEEAKTTDVDKGKDLFAYNLTGMKEAGVDITKKGFGITGKLALGWGQYVRGTMAVNTSGVFMQAYMREFKLANLLTVSGAGPDGRYGTADDGMIIELKLNNKVQSLTASGLIDLCGAMAETELILSSDMVRFYTKANLFGLFKTVFLAEVKFTDFDFFLAGAIENNFIDYIEKQATAALDKVNSGVESITKKAQKGIASARRDVDSLKKQIRAVEQDLKEAEADYKASMNQAQKAVDAAARSVIEQDRNMSSELRKVLAARERLLSGRKKINNAMREVNTLNDEVTRAIRKLKSLSRMKWYEFWKIAEMAYWSTRLVGVQTARGIALGALEVAKMSLVPIAGLLTATYAVSYAGAKASLYASYYALEAAVRAANPLTTDKLAKVLGLGIELAALQTSYYTAQGALITSSATMEAIRETTSFATDIAKTVIETVATVFQIKGGGFKVEYSRLKKGLLDLYLNAVVFGTKKNLKVVLDMTRPDRTLASLGVMIADIFNPTVSGGGNDIFKEIEAKRKLYFPDLDALEKQKQQAQKQIVSLREKQEAQAAEQSRLKLEHAQRLIDMEKKYPYSGDDIKNMVVQDASLELSSATKVVNEESPESYTISEMKGVYYWLDKWHLPEEDAGTVIFDVSGTRDIYVGFHANPTHKELNNTRSFDVILGTKANTANIIRNAEYYTIFASGDPEGMVLPKKEKETQSYWVSYNKGYLAVGRGREVGESLLFDAVIPEAPKGINRFSFSCADNALSLINIKTAAPMAGSFGRQYSAYNAFSRFSWPFSLPTPNAATITFNAKAEENLTIGFTDNPNVPFARYIATIGAQNNTGSSIAVTSKDGSLSRYIALEDDHNALLPTGSPLAYQPYWAIFQQGRVAIGRGTAPGENTIIDGEYDQSTLGNSQMPAAIITTTPPPEPSQQEATRTAQPALPKESTACSIGYASFSCWDKGVEIRNIAVKEGTPLQAPVTYHAIDRQYTCAWKDAWAFSETGRGIVTWKAKGKDGISIALHTEKGATESAYTYLCIFGENKNAQTSIRSSDGTVVAKTTDPIAMVPDNTLLHDYWCAYDNGFIWLGTGPEPGKEVVLEYQGENKPITHFSFTNGAGHVAFKSMKAHPFTPLPRGTLFTAMPKSPIAWSENWKINEKEDFVLILAAQTGQGLSIGLKGEDNTSYTIIIGGENGATASIADQSGASLFSKQTPTKIIGDQRNYYTYWLHYTRTTGLLSFGIGDYSPRNTLGSATLPGKPLCNSFGIGNPSVTPLFCKRIAVYRPADPLLATEYGETLRRAAYAAPMTAENAYSWDDIGALQTPNAGMISFRTRSKSPLTLGIGSKEDGASYEINISSTDVMILKNKEVQARSKDASALLSATGDLSEYWISFYKGHIALGTGTETKKNLMLEWFDPAPPKTITHYAFSGQADSIFTNITTYPGEKLPLYQVYSACAERGVPHWLNQWILPKPDKGLITFDVQAKEKACVCLGGEDAEPIYTIQIADTCTITKRGTILASAATSVRLSQQDSMPFWLLFDNGYIALGTGETADNETLLLDYQDIANVEIIKRFALSSTTDQVTYRSITASAATTNALKRNTSFTAQGRKKTYIFAEQWKLFEESKGTLIFDVTGDGPYYVGLDGRLGLFADPLFEIVFGAEKNTQAQIRKGGNVMTSSIDPHGLVLMPKQQSSYWVTFNKNRISAGYGKKPGLQTLLDWQDAVDNAISYFSFSGDTGTAVYKNIAMSPPAEQESSDECVIAPRKGEYTFKQSWQLTESDRGAVQFNALAKSTIGIGFHNGTTGQPLYEAIIGADENSRTVIKANGAIVASIEGDNAVIQAATTPVPQPYWAAYDHGTVAVGSGKTVGKNVILLWTDPAAAQGKDINRYGFCAGQTQIAVQKITPQPGLQWAPGTVYAAYNKNGSYQWPSEWRLRQGQTLTCAVTAPGGEVFIGLNSVANGLPRYSAIIGGWQNTKSAIMKGSDILQKYDVTMKPLTKSLWLTYQDNKMSVGTGQPNQKELFSYSFTEKEMEELSQDPLLYFSLSSGQTGVLYENIAVTQADAVLSAPAAQEDAPAIALMPLPKTAAPAAITLEGGVVKTAITTETYLSPAAEKALAASTNAPQESLPSVSAPQAANNTPAAQAGGTEKAAATAKPEEALDFLKSLNPQDIVTVDTTPLTAGIRVNQQDL